MAPNKLDKIFKDKFENLSEIPEQINWNKEDAWRNLNKTKSNSNLFRIAFSSVAVFLFGLTLFYFSDTASYNNAISNNKFQDNFEELQKRKKLKQIEMRLSGKKVYKNYCMNCEGLLPANNKNHTQIKLFTN